LLLLSCANIANLQIARALALAGDHALRRTLGSSRWGLLRLPLLESLLLGALGALLGLLLALALTRAMAAYAPADLPRLHALRFDPAVAAGVALLTVAMMALGGLLPGWLALRAADGGAIGHGARSSPAAGRLRSGLVVIQFALASLLLSGASVLGVQLLALLRTDPGFDSAHLLIARISLPEVVDDASHQRALSGYERLLDEVRALPGVRSAALTNEVPMGDLDTGMEVVAGTDPAALHAAVQASWRIVSSDYLGTLGSRLLRGRDFQPSGENPRTILLSEGLAQRLWPEGQEALGRYVTLGNGRTHQVVGIVGDIRQSGLAEQPTPTMYLPTSWYLWPTMTLTVRSSGNPSALIAAVRARAAALFPERPLFDVQPLQTLVDADSATQRQQFVALAAFALASLLLAGIGIAASMSYAIGQRRRELAVRMAVGASARRLQADVVRSGVALSAVGLLSGALIALLLHQFIGSQVALPPDAGAGLIPTLLGALALGALASAIAARRITAIAPAGALRSM
jgi:predicted permease